MQRWYVIGVGLCLLSLLSGCFLNPYSSNFRCPKTENGQCVSVSSAYDQSLKNGNSSGKSEKSSDSAKKDQSNSEKDTYQRELFHKLAGMIKEPTTPIVVPPTAMRGLALSFVGDENELYSYQYVFFFVDQPSWIFGDYLNSGIEGETK